MALKIETEVKIESEPSVIAWDGKLYIGTENGSVKTFDANLTPGVSWSAHGAQLFAIAALNSKVYTASNDGGIRVWSNQGEKITELPTADEDISILHVFDKSLYAGDELGNVLVYEHLVEKARYNVLEEVKDLWFSPPFLFTVRDNDVTVTEIKPDESHTRFITRHTMEGRAPLRVSGTRLIVAARGGNNLRLHDASPETEFKQLHEIKVSDMIITSLSINGDYAWTGGWDGVIRRYRIAHTYDTLEPAGELNIGGCINGIATTMDSAYVIASGGKLVRIKTV